MVALTPLPHKLGDPSGPVDTSSQVSTPDYAEMSEASLEEIPAAPSPTARTQGPSSGPPPADAGHLWEEANKALGGLLSTKSSINVLWQKLVWELSMGLCWNDSETTESIKEAKPICAHSTQEARILCSTTIKEAKATCTCSIQEGEILCSMAVRDVEAPVASQADSLHWSHAKSIRHLEEQAIEEESKSQLNLLSACQAALQASPVELCSVLVASYHLLLGQTLMSHPFSLSQGASSSEQVSAPVAPFPLVPEHSPRPKWWHPSPGLVDVSPPGRTTSRATLEGPPISKQQEIMPLHKLLKWTHLEAFSCDSNLVRNMREEYLKRYCSNFNTENTHDLSDIFWCMAKTSELLGSAIYKIREVWAGPDELWQANYAQRTLPKGLTFLRAVPILESPKVMGLTGIHDLDTLCHFNGMTHFPWWMKMGQNEGTVINHFWTVHYRLCLMCEKCFSCPSTLLDTICHHGQKDCQPSGEGGPNKSSLLA